MRVTLSFNTLIYCWSISSCMVDSPLPCALGLRDELPRCAVNFSFRLDGDVGSFLNVWIFFKRASNCSYYDALTSSKSETSFDTDSCNCLRYMSCSFSEVLVSVRLFEAWVDSCVVCSSRFTDNSAIKILFALASSQGSFGWGSSVSFPWMYPWA